jgi:hypothetical protein
MFQKTVVIVRVDISRESVPEVLYAKGNVGVLFTPLFNRSKKRGNLAYI